MMCRFDIETFHASIIAPNATMVTYRILFGGMHPVECWLEREEMNDDKMEGRKEIFYLMTHSRHFIYSYMASDIW